MIGRIIKAALLYSLIGTGPALAATDRYNVTPEEHAACDADAVALCSDAFPDEDKLLACMKANRSKLSLICHASLEDGLRRRHMKL